MQLCKTDIFIDHTEGLGGSVELETEPCFWYKKVKFEFKMNAKAT